METMRAVARALDVDGMQARISFTEIVLTISRRGIFRTQLAQIVSPGVNADRIAALQRFAHELPEHMTVAEVERRLDEVVARGRRYPGWAGPLAAGLACAAFAFLNNGGWLEVLAVAVAASCGQTVRHKMAKAQLNQLAVVFVAAVVATLVYLGTSRLLAGPLGSQGTYHAAGFVSAVLFLVPGFPLITATLDLARLDLAAGISRLTYAGLVTVTAALAMWSVASMAGLPTERAPALAPTPAALILLRIAATFAGVFGFAVIFNTPLRVALAAGVIAVAANLARLHLLEAAVSPQAAAALATLLLGLLAWAMARAMRLPRIIMSVPAVVIMIPGAAAYRGLVLFNEGQLLAAIDEGIVAVVTVVGLAAGLAAARMLTDPKWAFTGREHA